MTTTTRTTSLDRVLDKAREQGWLIDVEPVEITVKDLDSPKVIRTTFGGRVRWAPTKEVPGVKVTFDNGLVREGTYDPRAGIAYFDADGRFIKGSYSYGSVTETLRTLDRNSPDVVRANLDARKEARLSKYVQAQEAAQQALTDAYGDATKAQAAAYKALLAEGLDHAQATAVVVLLQQQGGPLLTLPVAAVQVRSAQERLAQAVRDVEQVRAGRTW